MTTRIHNTRLSGNIIIGVDARPQVEWISPNPNIGVFQQYNSLFEQLEASNATVYYLTSGALPNGISIAGNFLFGAFSDQQEISQFSIEASGINVAPATRNFTIIVGVVPPPMWITPAGLLDDVEEDTSVSIQLQAVDNYGFPVSYSISGGSLPTGLSLDANTGIISGVISDTISLAPNGEYDFTVSATNGYAAAEEDFQLYVETLATANVWVTNAGLIGYGFGTGQFDTSVYAHDANGLSITYEILAGDIPLNLGFDSNTGQISGTLAEVPVGENILYKVLIGARTSDYVARRMFEIEVKYDYPPVITPVYSSTEVIENNPISILSNVVSTNDPELALSFTAVGLPSFMTLDANTGTQYSNAIGEVPTDITYTYKVYVSDNIKTSNTTVSFRDVIDTPPVFQSGELLLRQYGNATIATISPLAIDNYGRPILYTLESNANLYGLTFNSNTGQFTGTLPDTANGNIFINTTVTATAQAFPPISNTVGNSATQNFTIIAYKDVYPEFITNQGNIGEVIENYPFNNEIIAIDPNGIRTVVFTLTSSEQPAFAAPGVPLSMNGALIGYAEGISEPNYHVYSFDVTASYEGLPLDFYPVTNTFAIVVEKHIPPVWITNAGLIPEINVSPTYPNQLGDVLSGIHTSTQLLAQSPNDLPLYYELSNSTLPTYYQPGSTGPAPTLDAATGIISGYFPDFISYTSMSEYAMPQTGQLDFVLPSGSLVNPGDLIANYSVNSTTYEITSQDGGIWNASYGHNYVAYTGAIIGSVSVFDTSLETETYDFTATVNDGLFYVPQDFSLTVSRNLPPTWVTNPGVVFDAPSFDINNGNAAYQVVIPLEAIDPEGQPTRIFQTLEGITPQIIPVPGSGTDSYVTFNGSNEITGILPVVYEDTYYDFTMYAWDNSIFYNDAAYFTTPQYFRIWNRFDLAPVWVTPSTLNFNDGQTSDLVFFADYPGANSTCNFSISEGSLPPNLQLIESNGAVIGTLDCLSLGQQSNSFVFTVVAHNTSYNKRTASQTFTMNVYYDNAPTWISNISPQIFFSYLANNSLEDSPNSLVVAENNSGPYGDPLTYSLVNSGTLPESVSAFPTPNGLALSGKLPFALTGAEYTFEASAYDGSKTITNTFVLATIPTVPPVFTTPNATVGYWANAYANTYLMSNSIAAIAAYDPQGNAITFSLADDSTLPGTLSIDSDGYIVGLTPSVNPPTYYNNYTFNVVANSGTVSKKDAFTLQIRRHIEPVWQSNGYLGFVAAGQQFSTPLVATDYWSDDTLTYTLTGGSLPTGMTIDANTGAILGGAPVLLNNSITYNFEATVSDGFYQVANSFSILVQQYEPPVLVPNTIVYGVSPAAENVGTILTVAYQSNSFSGQLYGFSPVLLEDATNSPSPINYGIVNRGSLNNFIEVIGPPEFYLSNCSYDFNNGIFSGENLVVVNGATTYYTFNFSAYDGIQTSNGIYFVELNYTAPNFVPPPNYTFTGKPQNFSKTLYATSPPAYANAVANTSPINYGIYSAKIYGNGDSVGNSNVANALSYDFETGILSGTVPVTNGATSYSLIFSVDDGLNITNVVYYIDLEYSPPIFYPNAGSILSVQFEQTEFNEQVYAYAANFEQDLANGITTSSQIYNYEIINVTFGNSSNANVAAFTSSITNENYISSVGILQAHLDAVPRDTIVGLSLIANDGVSVTSADYYIDVIFNSPPTFLSSNVLANATEQEPYTAQIVAISNSTIQNSTIYYSITGGSFPSTLTLSANGYISGSAPPVNNTTTFEFDVTASTGIKQSTEQTYLTVNKLLPPVWVTPSNLANAIEYSSATYLLYATDPQGLSITYTLQQDGLPTGWTFNANAGNGSASVSGVAPGVGATGNSYTFTVGASDGYIRTDATFTLPVIPTSAPVWQTTGLFYQQFSQQQCNTSVVAISPQGQPVTYVMNTAIYAWPTWLTLNSNTGALSGTLPLVFANTAYSFAIDATNGFSYTTQVLEILDISTVNGYFKITDPHGNTSYSNGVSQLSQQGQYTINFLTSTRVYMEAWGAAGGTNVGGVGGYSSGYMSVGSGTTFTVVVGGPGSASSGSGASGGTGGNGFGGGGACGVPAIVSFVGSGGGLTGIFVGSSSTNSTVANWWSNSVLIAGGGGGGTAGGLFGGPGGGSSGSAGQSGGYEVYSGQGGSQSGGGAFGSGIVNNGSTGGGELSGGSGGASPAAGAGGAGYYGGGGGSASRPNNGYPPAPGGGGSGYVNSNYITNALTSTASLGASKPPNSTDIYYIANTGCPASSSAAGSTSYGGLFVFVVQN